MKQAAYDICYLAACAVNGVTPLKERCEAMELNKIYKMSKLHSLAALCAMALTSSGIVIDDEWKSDRDKAVRKNILFDSERAKLFKFMEENGIWYLPLKGIIMKDLYPKLGMREMADNDILFDKACQRRVMEFMKSNGYTVGSYGQSNHDTYTKKPVFNFELHTSLFHESAREVFYKYYENITDRLVRDEDRQFGYHMSDEDYYIYITAHEYKHYTNSGTGLRSMLDRYVFLTKKQDKLDFNYIIGECEKLGIAEFEKKCRVLCNKVFGNAGQELTEEETELLEYYMFSTTYGTLAQSVRHRFDSKYEEVNAKNKLHYILRRIFPSVEFYKAFWPPAYKYKILIPVAWFYRVIKTIFKNGKSVLKEFSIVNNLEKGE